MSYDSQYWSDVCPVCRGWMHYGESFCSDSCYVSTLTDEEIIKKEEREERERKEREKRYRLSSEGRERANIAKRRILDEKKVFRSSRIDDFLTGNIEVETLIKGVNQYDTFNLSLSLSKTIESCVGEPYIKTSIYGDTGSGDLSIFHWVILSPKTLVEWARDSSKFLDFIRSNSTIDFDNDILQDWDGSQ